MSEIDLFILEISQKEDLISDNNQFIVKSNHKLRELNISPLDFFRLTSVIDAIPAEWPEWLTTSAPHSR